LAIGFIKPHLENCRNRANGLTEHTRTAVKVVGYLVAVVSKLSWPMSTRGAGAQKKAMPLYCSTNKDGKVFTECDIMLLSCVS